VNGLAVFVGGKIDNEIDWLGATKRCSCVDGTDQNDRRTCDGRECGPYLEDENSVRVTLGVESDVSSG